MQIKFKLLLALITSFSLSSCHKEQPLDCDFKAIIQDAATELEVDINNLSIEGDCLTVGFAAGGCNGKTWDIKLIASETTTKSIPPQRKVSITLNSTELCKALIIKEVSFDISNLRAGVNSEMLYFSDSKSILYEY